jgi:hypothetical protein
MVLPNAFVDLSRVNPLTDPLPPLHHKQFQQMIAQETYTTFNVNLLPRLQLGQQNVAKYGARGVSSEALRLRAHRYLNGGDEQCLNIGKQQLES